MIQYDMKMTILKKMFKFQFWEHFYVKIADVNGHIVNNKLERFILTTMFTKDYEESQLVYQPIQFLISSQKFLIGLKSVLPFSPL
jgi:hypothetical protein